MSIRKANSFCINWRQIINESMRLHNKYIGHYYYNMKHAPPEKLAKLVSIVTTRQFPLRRSENGRVVTIRPDALLFDTFRVSFVTSQGFSKSSNPDVLKLFHRHSVWMIRISVLVKVNGIRHYSFIDLMLPCFCHK